MRDLLQSAPLMLFIILLLALSISVYFGNATTRWSNGKDGFFADLFGSKEGYISFNSEVPLINKPLIIPKYSNNNVHKIYDNIYYDPLNGNLLELVPDTGNTSVFKMYVYARSGAKNGPYDISNGVAVPEASLNQINSVIPPNAFIADSTFSPGVSPSVLYVAWGKNTYIHAMDLATNVNTSIVSAYFPENKSPPTIKNFDGTSVNSLAASHNYSLTTMLNVGTTTVTDTNDGLNVNVKYYDASRSVVQICKDAYYDPLNGKLLITSTDGSLNVYDRPASGIQTSAQTYNETSIIPKQQSGLNETTFAPIMILHPNKKYLIYYVAHSFNSAIIVLAKKNDSSLYKLKQYFYESNGMLVTAPAATPVTTPATTPAPAVTTTPAATPVTTPATDTTAKKLDVSANPLSDYYNWLAFWNTVATSNDIATAMQTSNYIPKTAVIPPVCPTCTQCSGGGCTQGGVCTGCGGTGGSGTTTTTKNRFSDFISLYGNSIINEYGGSSGSDGGIYGSGGDADSIRAYELAKAAGSGTVGLLKDTGSGAVGLAKDTVGGTVGLAKDTVGGAVGLAREAGSGVAGLLKTNPTQVTGPNMGGSGQSYGSAGADSSVAGLYNQPQGVGTRGNQNMIDQYSYNGALVSKGGNYIPITSDFSAFGK
jgi:hypothetical protein